MAEEVAGIIESGENGGSLNEGVNEAAIQKIQENARQIKKIAQQLQQNKKENNQLAKFLTFLLSEISNENIIKGLYDTFFITIDPNTNISYFRKSMNDIVVAGLFFPFFKEKADEIGISHYYENLSGSLSYSIQGYITYLQELSNHYHDNIPINQNSFIQLITEIIKEFLHDATDLPLIDQTKGDEGYKQIIYNQLFLGDID